MAPDYKEYYEIAYYNDAISREEQRIYPVPVSKIILYIIRFLVEVSIVFNHKEGKKPSKANYDETAMG